MTRAMRLQHRNTDRRIYGRHPLEMMVYFSLQDGDGKSSWYVGQMKDAGMGGIKIRSNRPVALRRGSKISLRCLLNLIPSDSDQKPVKIEGKIIWYDSYTGYFGLKYQ